MNNSKDSKLRTAWPRALKHWQNVGRRLSQRCSNVKAVLQYQVWGSPEPQLSGIWFHSRTRSAGWCGDIGPPWALGAGPALESPRPGSLQTPAETQAQDLHMACVNFNTWKKVLSCIKRYGAELHRNAPSLTFSTLSSPRTMFSSSFGSCYFMFTEVKHRRGTWLANHFSCAS